MLQTEFCLPCLSSFAAAVKQRFWNPHKLSDANRTDRLVRSKRLCSEYFPVFSGLSRCTFAEGVLTLFIGRVPRVYLRRCKSYQPSLKNNDSVSLRVLPFLRRILSPQNHSQHLTTRASDTEMTTAEDMLPLSPTIQLTDPAESSVPLEATRIHEDTPTVPQSHETMHIGLGLARVAIFCAACCVLHVILATAERITVAIAQPVPFPSVFS